MRSRNSVAGIEAQQHEKIVLKDNFNVTLPRMLQRRNAVSAEPTRLGELEDANFVIQNYPKTQAQRMNIQQILSGIVLFQGLSESVMKDMVGGFFEMQYSDGDVIIVQGDVIADKFFLLQSGQCDVFIKKGSGEPVKVHTVLPGGFFGELALLYNAPRAATIKSVGESKLWALDRGTFKNCMARAARDEARENSILKQISVNTTEKQVVPVVHRGSVELVNEQVLQVADSKSMQSEAAIPSWSSVVEVKVTGRNDKLPDKFTQFLLIFKYP
jgi:hypothetical protein